MSTSNTDKVIINYHVRDINNAQTGEKIKFPFTDLNGNIGPDRFCSNLASDTGRRAGTKDQIHSNIKLIFEKVREWLLQGYSVNLGDYLKFSLHFRGEVDKETGKPTDETSLITSVTALKNMKISKENMQFVQLTGETSTPKFTSIYACQEEAVRDQIVRGVAFYIVGNAFCYKKTMGDNMTVTYTSEGVIHTEELTPTEVSTGVMKFDFPEVLTNLPDETELTLTLRTRSGIENGAFNVASRKATLVAK